MENKYLVEWWEETNDISTDYDQKVVAASEEEAIVRVKKRNPLARKLTAKEI